MSCRRRRSCTRAVSDPPERLVVLEVATIRPSNWADSVENTRALVARAVLVAVYRFADSADKPTQSSRKRWRMPRPCEGGRRSESLSRPRSSQRHSFHGEGAHHVPGVPEFPEIPGDGMRVRSRSQYSYATPRCHRHVSKVFRRIASYAVLTCCTRRRTDVEVRRRVPWPARCAGTRAPCPGRVEEHPGRLPPNSRRAGVRRSAWAGHRRDECVVEGHDARSSGTASPVAGASAHRAPARRWPEDGRGAGRRRAGSGRRWRGPPHSRSRSSGRSSVVGDPGLLQRGPVAVHPCRPANEWERPHHADPGVPSSSRCCTASRRAPVVTPMLGMSSEGALSGRSDHRSRCSTMRRWSSSDSIEITMTIPAAPSATHCSSTRRSTAGSSSVTTSMRARRPRPRCRDHLQRVRPDRSGTPR